MTNSPCRAPNTLPPRPNSGPKWRKGGVAGPADPGNPGAGVGLVITALEDAADVGEWVAARAAPAPPSSAATATPAMMYGRRDPERRPSGPIGRVAYSQPARAEGSSWSAGSGWSAGIHQTRSLSEGSSDIGGWLLPGARIAVVPTPVDSRPHLKAR